MSWDDYRRTYYTYMFSVAQVKLLTIVAEKVLKTFPEGLPPHLRDPFVKDMKMAVETLGKEMEVARREGAPRSIELPHESDIFGATFEMINVGYFLHGSMAHPDFERSLLYQWLVMVFAHLDAFIADTVRAICQVRPEVLKSDRKMSWEAILDYGEWEELLNQMVERYVLEIGWPPIRKRIEFLIKEFGLEIDFPSPYINVIEQAENDRHVVLHNGARISQEYIDRTQRRDVRVGDLIPLNREYLEKIHLHSSALASAVMRSVAKKFFEVQDSDLPKVHVPLPKPTEPSYLYL